MDNDPCHRSDNHQNMNGVLKSSVISRHFEEIPDSYSGYFFSSVQRDRYTFLFICSTSSTLTTDLQNILEPPEPRPKQKHRRPEPR